MTFPSWSQVAFSAFVVVASGGLLGFACWVCGRELAGRLVRRVLVALADVMAEDERKVAARTERPFSETTRSGK